MNDSLKAYSFDGPPINLADGRSSPASFQPSSTLDPSLSVGNPGAMLSLSANGNTDGIVWASRALCNAPVADHSVFEPHPGRLMAFDAKNVTRLLWDSASAAAFRAAPAFEFSKNAPPTIANGKVFVPSFPTAQTPGAGTDDAAVLVYGLMAIPQSKFAVSQGSPGVVSSTGGSLAASPQFGLPNNTDVFAIDNNGQLNVAWVNGKNPWNGPAEPTHNSNNRYLYQHVLFPPGAPVAASQQFGLPNNTDVFAVDVNGNLDVAWVAGGGSWQGPSAIGAHCSNGSGGYFTRDGQPCQFLPRSNIAVSQQFPIEQTDVFIVDSKGALTVSWVAGGGNWQSAEITAQGLFPPGAPLAASQQLGLNQTDVFIVDNTGKLNVVYNYQADTCTPLCNWAGPALVGNGGKFPLRAHIATSPQFGVANNTDVFAVDETGTLNVAWVNSNNPFNGPVQLVPSGFTPSAAGLFPPGAALAASQQFGADATGQTDVFIVDTGGLLRVMWVEGQNLWQGPATVGTGLGRGGFQPGASIAVSQQFGADATGQTDVFVVDGLGNRTVTWADGKNPFNGPVEIPSVTTLSPDVASLCPNH
jgi:hypothetical protein